MAHHNVAAAREAVARHRLPPRGYAHRREAIAFIVRDAEAAAFFVVMHTGDVAPGLAQVGYADAMIAHEEAASIGYPVRAALEGPIVPFTIRITGPDGVKHFFVEPAAAVAPGKTS
jgi:hypothetical protein